MRARLLVATSNPGKLAEIAEALRSEAGAGAAREADVEVVGLEALGGGPQARAPVEESGDTFEANARIKAEAYSRRTPEPMPVIADDSGLEVDALGGEPGVASARYGGEGLDDEGRWRLLLERLRGVPEERRGARFRCVLAVAREGATVATFEGAVEGRILGAPRGRGGFGYDPVFFHEGAGRTFAELSREEKRRLSHRGEAIRRLVESWRGGKLRLE